LLESVAGASIPLAVYPNSGEQWNPDAQDWSGEACEEMPVREWYERGARIFGGCCRTPMEELTRMRSILSEFTEKPGGR
jgi:homocysteine S-methyltransferase